MDRARDRGRAGHQAAHGVLASACFALGLVAGGASAAPLLDGLGGPLDLGGVDTGDDPVDIEAAFPDGLRLYGAAGVTDVWLNRTAVLSLGGPACCYEGQPLPSARAFDDLLGRIHALEANLYDNQLSPDGPGWFVYRHLHPDGGAGDPGRLVATWHAMPDRPLERADARFLSAQLVLTNVGGGDFDVELRYARCEWSVGQRMNNDRPVIGFDADEGADGPGWMWPG